MISKGSKLPAGRGQASIVPYKQMFARFRAQMGTISLDVADLSMDLQALRESLSRWEAAFDATQGLQAKPSKTLPRTANPRTSTRHKVSS